MSASGIQDLQVEDLKTEELQDNGNGAADGDVPAKAKTKSRKKKKAENVPTQPKKAGGKRPAGQAQFLKQIAEARQELDRLEKEKEEKLRKEEEERQKALEKQRLEEEKKEREKQKRKERKQKQKQEGKYLSKAQHKKKVKDQENLKKMIESGATVVGFDDTTKLNIPIVIPDKKSSTLEKMEPVVESLSSDTDKNYNDLPDIIEKVHLTPHHQTQDPALRIRQRVEESTLDETLTLRAPIICVMGHVDTGKTKILDKLRNTNVQTGEAGGITQQIGMTNVPLYAVKKSVSVCPYMKDFQYRLDGLAIIDTPGHFSFRNLRSLGSSLCDMAILIVDIMHSLEQQTIESIKLLRSKKTPFVVALNKVDLVTGWVSHPDKDIRTVLGLQPKNTLQHFNDLYKKTFVGFAELGLNLGLAWEVDPDTEFLSAIPTSAKTGDGIGDLLAYICKYSQCKLEKRLTKSQELTATIMDVKVVLGLGPTVDIILANGTLHQGDKIIVPGIEGPIVSQIRALITPQPMKEMRVKGQDEHHDSISACQGVRIAGNNLENAIAGLPMFVAQYDDEVDHYVETLSTLITKTFSSFHKKDKGVYVQASTLGSLEALLDFLKDSDVPYFGYNIGPVHKKDVITAMTMLDRNPMYAVILAFDVKVDQDAQAMANKSGIKIFTADIIYHLYNDYSNYEKNYKKQQADQHRHKAIFPCSLKIIPTNVFKTRDPIIVGVRVEEGTARIGTPLCVPSRNNVVIGIIGSMEMNHKPIELAKKGQEICIKIANFGDEAPKMIGRHFEITDQIVSKISRDSIDVLKDYFRDEMTKEDWLLVKQLKTTFGII
ncbi:Eukaryotic translation initiation factor 5B [Thelohanellus kitauei]|uniref:Eukaryotic translation initiation factor 5B n=1 Tax=Thelohanellus kitauei TaxID=669202 RepID=A0A0C2N2S2_THEKT|nr:Eukaryotic translation initiation factor 5B [Thelohanellus kitauei]